MLTFPTLGVLTYPQIDPVFLDLGFIQFRWYGLAYIVGILCGWLYGRHLAGNSRLWPNGVSPITKTNIDDLILYITLGIVLGGRLGYALFYDFERYAAAPLEIFKVWDGGMSFHGGMIGVVLAILVFCRQYNLPLFSLIDVVAASVPFGLFFGRIANFINGELWGAPTTVPWAMVFPDAPDALPRHPSQLYEAALEGIVLWLILRIVTHRFAMFRRPRFTGAVFIFFYGCARIFIEFFRMPDAQLGYLYGGWLTMGMVLSAPMLIVGIWGMATAKPRSYEVTKAETDTLGAKAGSPFP